MSAVLVTGGAGYVGSILVPQLLAAGHEVTVVDNFMYGQTSLLDVCHDSSLTIVRGDARDEELMKSHVADKDFIIPLACLVGAPACEKDPVTAESVNKDAVLMLLRLRRAGQKIVFPNTNSGYGRMAKGVAYCDETSKLDPVSLYGRLKVETEKELLAAGDVVVFRLATVCGVSPRMRLDLLVNDFVYRAVTDRAIVLFEGHFKRNFIHVRDASAAYLHAMAHFDEMKDGVYNVGLSNANLSKTELCEKIQEQVPEFVFVESGASKDPDRRNYIVSNEKIEATGWKPNVSIDEAIAELIKGFEVIQRNEFTNLM